MNLSQWIGAVLGRPRSLGEHMVLEKAMPRGYAGPFARVNAARWPDMPFYSHSPTECVPGVVSDPAIAPQIGCGLGQMLRPGAGTMGFPGMAGKTRSSS